VLSLPPSVRIYLARGATDMRKQIDGLAALVEHVLERDAFSGHLFVFCNRRRNRIKILYWEGSGFWLLHKRLEKGTFAWPAPAADKRASLQMSPAELAALLGGIDVRSAPRRRWFSRKNETRSTASASSA
jgi:transposase